MARPERAAAKTLAHRFPRTFADGTFHAAMYVLAGLGLWFLWRARRQFGERYADRVLWANLVIGFGASHVVDRGATGAAVLVAAVIGGATVGALPPRDVSQVMVYFGPDAPAERVFAAAAVDARVIWSDRSGALWALDLPLFSAGCPAWSRAT